MKHLKLDYDVIIIGAGPSGAVAAALLNQRGYRVMVLERTHFPRFSIGESLLPQCMDFLAEANMLDAVQKAGFQFKNGAAFSHAEHYSFFDFNEKFTEGHGTTFQVQRDKFDKILADTAEQQGVTFRYGQTVTSFCYQRNLAQVGIQNDAGENYQLNASFVLDGSGYGRVLSKLLHLEKPSTFPSRTSLFTHIQDHISDPKYDRNKILVSVHPKHQDIWFWLIPFSNGRASIGVVAEQGFIDAMSGSTKDKLQLLVNESGWMAKLLSQAEFDSPANALTGYASDVTTLHGPGFALLGNAGEFLDPVFSSGVTIALKSASLASAVLDQELKGNNPDWQTEFTEPLQQGVKTFKEFVSSWYRGGLQDIIFSSEKSDAIERMICSILAGYAWDTNNPYVQKRQRLKTLEQICGPQ